MYSKSGVIASPNWPNAFTKGDLPWPSRDCEWDIETDTKRVIQLNVMDIDFGSSSSSYCSKYQNHLKLKGFDFLFFDIFPRHYFRYFFDEDIFKFVSYFLMIGEKSVLRSGSSVSYTHLTLPTIYSV